MRQLPPSKLSCLLKARFEYRKTGGLFYIKNINNKKVGERFGYLTNGYVAGSFLDCMVREHVLIWLWHFEKWPMYALDHINRIRDDNRIENLREASHEQNAQNTGITRRNSSGFKGVYFNKAAGKFQAYVRGNYLGLFVTAKEAALAYDEQASIMYGAFAHLNFPKKERL